MDQRDRLEFALEATRTGLWSFDRHLGLVQVCERTRTLIGSGVDDPLPLGRFLDMFDPEDRTTVEGLLDDPVLAMAGAHEVEVRMRQKDHRMQRWVALRARRGSAGEEVIGSVRDVSDIKRYDTQVHLLMREVTHRSKNLLAIIQAMARQTVKDSLSASEFETRFSARLRGLSFSHELLARQDWRGASLMELAEGHLSHLRDHHGDRVQIDGPVVFIRPEAAQNIGLALNELSSNAQQFGALAGHQGTVTLEWHIDADERGPHALHLIWTEAGAAVATQPPSRQGFGHRIMERVVARALDGTVEMTFAPSGLQWSLRIPLTHIASDGSN